MGLKHLVKITGIPQRNGNVLVKDLINLLTKHPGYDMAPDLTIQLIKGYGTTFFAFNGEGGGLSISDRDPGSVLSLEDYSANCNPSAASMNATTPDLLPASNAEDAIQRHPQRPPEVQQE